MMMYESTFRFGSKQAAQQFAGDASGFSGGATLTETEGYWVNGGLTVESGAQVAIVHHGGGRSAAMFRLARQAAHDFGESRVLHTIHEVASGMLDAHDYTGG